MNKSEISKEILSQIFIEIEDTLFYVPGETVKGTIKIFPGVKLNINDNQLNFKLKLLQYEFWEYLTEEKIDFKNVYKTEIKEKSFQYKFKNEENKNIDEKVDFSDFSMIVIEKEESDKFISVPFEFKLDENDEKLLPTFQYENEAYFLGVRHLLIIKSVEYCSTNYIGLFIGKQRKSKIIKENKLVNNYYAGLGTLDVKLTIPKQSYYFGEVMPFKLESKANLLFKKVTEIKTDLCRKIEWVGYLKNTLLNKTSMPSDDFIYNQDKYGIIAKLTLPLQILTNISLNNYFGLNGFKGFFGFSYFISELCSKYKIFQEILRLDGKKKDFNENKKMNTKFDESLSINYTQKELKQAAEEFRKFVYFKDNKIVGFVRFIRDITPPLNGYYFNCNYNFIINIHIAGFVMDQDKTIKKDIEFYDGDDYIIKMKKLLKTNNY